ncbi:MAG TPA: hypothetical protein VLH19_04040 [Patescibacteria group bacterium]|nr:hypothetical protein [Patescibacteria group bacterium]
MYWFLALVGLASGNYLWQAFHDQKWSVAFERSYFQALAIVFVILTKPRT